MKSLSLMHRSGLKTDNKMTMYFFASLIRSRWRSTNLLQKFFLREKKNIVFSLDIQGCKLQQLLSQKEKGFFQKNSS